MLGGSAAAERMVMEKYFTGGENMRGKLNFMFSLLCHIKHIKNRGESKKTILTVFSMNPFQWQFMRIAFTKFLHQGKDGTLYHEASKR